MRNLKGKQPAETSTAKLPPKEIKPEFTFSALGDLGANENTTKVINVAKQSDFILALGDLSYGQTKTEEEWCAYFHKLAGDKYPLSLIPGNHDVERNSGFKQGEYEKYISCLPNRIPNLVGDHGKQYYFDYKNLARFIAVSPNVDVFGYTAEYRKGDKDFLWLDTVIGDAKNQGLKWIVLGMHKNCITMGVKSCEIGEDIINLAVEKGVDLILQGHEHSYMRSKQLFFNDNCNKIEKNKFNNLCVKDSDDNLTKGGTTLVISGAGGYELRDINTQDSEAGYFAKWIGKNSDPSYGTTIVDVYKNKLDILFKTSEGLTKDHVTIND